MSFAPTSTVVPIKPFAWSYSALKNFETCPKRYLHYNVLKDVVEPESTQLAEGNRLHDVFAKRLSKGAGLPLGYAQFESMLARIAAAPGTLSVEQKLAITGDFQPVGFFGKGVWARSVIDAVVVSGTTAVVFDWKTGKPSVDETQLAIMAGTIFVHQPQVTRVKAALVFVHHQHTEPAEYVREDQASIWNEIIPRVRALQKAIATQEYPPRPSGLCKKYCAVVSCPYYGRGA